MRIANTVAFGTIEYLLGGETKLNIKFRRLGYWKEEIFDGTLFALRERKNDALRLRLEKMRVTALHAEDDIIFVGVDE